MGDRSTACKLLIRRGWRRPMLSDRGRPQRRRELAGGIYNVEEVEQHAQPAAGGDDLAGWQANNPAW